MWKCTLCLSICSFPKRPYRPEGPPWPLFINFFGRCSRKQSERREKLTNHLHSTPSLRKTEGPISSPPPPNAFMTHTRRMIFHTNIICIALAIKKITAVLLLARCVFLRLFVCINWSKSEQIIMMSLFLEFH
jgi:hypothetical protein